MSKIWIVHKLDGMPVSKYRTSSDFGHLLYILFCLFQIVDVNLTSESRVKVELNAKLPFTYEVIWKQTDTKFVDRFDKYLDPNFFQHRVRKM